MILAQCTDGTTERMSTNVTVAGNSVEVPSLIVRSDRPMRMAGFACLVVLFTAVYVGFDVNQAIGLNKNVYDVAIPATRLLSDIEFEMQESRHAMVHGGGLAEPRRARAGELLGQFEKLRLPASLRARVMEFEQRWKRYLESDGTLEARDRLFQETTAASRLVHDGLDEFAKNSAAGVRMAFVRAGFELVLLLLGTLHMISVLATNGEKRKALESLRVLNQRLQTARAAAEESSKLKSEFLATVSHEIRTPMNGIIGMAELLSRSGLNEEQKSYNETVRVSAEALLSILNDILDFSRIEAGKLVIDSAAFMPADPAFQMADLLAPAAAQKGLEFVVRIAPNVPRLVVGDAGRVRQILMNLAGNAIKFTHTGHVLVAVEGMVSSGRQCRVRFTVQDTGIGIQPSKIDTLFEKFIQADASTTRRYGGTGLGLAISRKLVELMGGSIQVKTEEGVGSTFWFDLSFEVEDGETAIHAPFAESGPRVLLIEPSEVSASTILEMLGQLGASATRVATAEAAVQILEEGAAKWQAVFLSSRFQATDAGAFVRIQRLVGKGNRLMVLAPRGRVDAALTAREVRVLGKPLPRQMLEEALRVAVSDKGSLRTATRGLQELAVAVAEKPVRPVAGSGLRILVAEDNIVNQTIVRKLLEEAGCLVDVASNGSHAVAQWEDGHYDLILMDCQMPEVDGFEATREIRRRELAGERVPIVAITANVLDKDRTHCFAAGMDDFLSKPLRLGQLQDAVAKWTAGRRQRDAEGVPAG